MHYETLSEANLSELVRERVQVLEADHFRWNLRLAEAASMQEAGEIEGTIRDLKRRIDVHLSPDEPEPAEPAEPSVAATNGHVIDMPPVAGDDESGAAGRVEPTTSDHSLDDVER